MYLHGYLHIEVDIYIYIIHIHVCLHVVLISLFPILTNFVSTAPRLSIRPCSVAGPDAGATTAPRKDQHKLDPKRLGARGPGRAGGGGGLRIFVPPTSKCMFGCPLKPTGIRGFNQFDCEFK